MKQKFKPILLFDMDSITVEMTPKWLELYYKKTGDLIDESKQTDWILNKLAKYPEVLDSIYLEDGFFYDLPPVVNAVEYISKFLEDNKVDIIFLTQLPKKSDFAARDKKKWVLKYFPKFELKQMMFAHRKELVAGNILVDDSLMHLYNWKQHNRFSITATINYPHNQGVDVDWRYNKNEFWKEFYSRVNEYYNL